MYTVKILSEEEFNKLPYKKAKTSLGLADPARNVAYIRDTGYNDITKSTIGHELDELLAKVSPHEEDGIRYLDLGSFFGNIGRFAKSVARPVAQGVGKVGSFLSSPFRTTGAPNDFSIFKGATYPQGVQNVFQRFTSPRASPLTAGAAGSAPQFKMPTLNIPSFQKLGTPAQQPAQRSAMGGIFDSFKDVLPGAAVSMLGNLFAPKVEAPDFSGITQGLREQVTNPVGNEFRALGGDELRRILTTPVGTPPEAAFAQGDIYSNRQLEDDLKNLRQQFKAVNPAADVEGNSAYLREQGRLTERAREQRTAARDELSFAFEREQLQRRVQAMQEALNIDQAQMSQLIELAQLDIGQIMLQAGLTAQEAMQVKELFGNLGSLLYQTQQNEKDRQTFKDVYGGAV